LQQLFCLSPEIVKNIDTIDTNLSNLHALLTACPYILIIFTTSRVTVCLPAAIAKTGIRVFVFNASVFCLCVSVNKSRRGSGEMSCIIDHHESSCKYSDRCVPMFVTLSGWLRGSVVERWSLTGEFSLSCARPAADG